MTLSHAANLPSREARDHAAGEVRNSAALLVERINQVVADAFTLYLKTKNFYWHVNGPHFRDYHLVLDEQAADVLATIDPLAERVRSLRGATVRSVAQVMGLRTLKDSEDEAVAPETMLRELMGDTMAVIVFLRETHKLWAELDAVATASLLEGYIDAAEKWAWFLRETVGPS
jgi:starvation-inducible DNA-binding protein